jgi:hypothetical protein
VKQAILFVIVVAAGFAGGVLWMRHSATTDHSKEQGAGSREQGEDSKKGKETAEAAGPKVSRDTNGNAVIALSSKMQKDLGILFTNLAASQLSPELKGYGRVLDPAPLLALMTELASAQAAGTASSKEVDRLKTLEGQGNASARALQTAEAAAARDRVAVQSARERLVFSWGKAVADQKELPAFAHDLGSLESALIRVDLPVGETLKDPPANARVSNLGGASADAAFLDKATSVDPQMQGQGFLFLLKPNSLRLTAGEAVVGHLQIPGEPIRGVIIPRDAVVRTEGAGWIYVLNAGGEGFTRLEVPLDHPTEAGWFVANGVTVSNSVVVTGAQQLLSFEARSAGGEE